MIKVTCPACHAELKAPDHKAGLKGTCSKCGAAVDVPARQEDSVRPAGADAPPAGSPAKVDAGVPPQASGEDERGDSSKAPPVAARMSSGLVIMPVDDITVVSFRSASILDATAIQAIGTELFALVDQKAMRKLVLDFSLVRFLSSQMLGVLVNLHKKSTSIQGRMVLCGLRPELLKIFSIMKLEKVLTIVDTEGKAFEALGYSAKAS